MEAAPVFKSDRLVALKSEISELAAIFVSVIRRLKSGKQ